ncbi:(2Fe-2S)-binding protein [Salinicoccus sp. YB14-2]|uniref:(2Fe-2S)-binding protein n=1 Tax=Salinicoccus sp. YB14-2 TaxID=1572701 RepID=UPI0006914289|nr:(2Fe-2S)-binding protein [Salinicoccus sp. YB14-2]
MNSNEDFTVCRCEGVTYSEILKEMDKGVNNSREMKLKTRAGMGFCNGRTCGHLINKITEDAEIETPVFIHLRAQPPIRTVSFEELSGGQFDDKKNIKP